ncbi:MAG: hypothetical protein JXA37_03985 [Chloroflexia bacterium]|nr:hypothetical protein [Chloroflexia bacterium]
MAQVQAWQHIYASVERGQSPQDRGGFQTLFYSRVGLSQAEIEEMEARLLYVPSEIAPPKWVFFVTSGGRCVCAQIVPLPDPDRVGRGGRYLAHSLVFESADWLELGADPFAVLGRYPFVTTVEAALERGDFASGDLPAAAVEAAGGVGPEDVAPWDPEQLLVWARLALHAPALAQERLTVALSGAAEQVVQGLRAAFFLLPVPLRQSCPFDTYFYRCNLVATYYWAVGLPDAPARPNLVRVDLSGRQVLDHPPQRVEGIYESWLAERIRAGRLQDLDRDREAAFALAEWLQDRPVDPARLEAVPQEVLEGMFRLQQPLLRRLLRQRLQEDVSLLAERAFDGLYERLSASDAFRCLRQGFEPDLVLQELSQSYRRQQFARPGREERQALADLLRVREHPFLRLLLAVWEGGREGLRQGLLEVGDDVYRAFVREALEFRLADPLDLLVAGRGDLFLRYYLRSDLAGEERLDRLARALLDVGDPDALVLLLPLLPECSWLERRGLRKIVEKYPDLPGEFQQAVLDG